MAEHTYKPGEEVSVRTRLVRDDEPGFGFPGILPQFTFRDIDPEYARWLSDADQDSLLRVVKAAMEGYCRACGGTGRRSMPCSDPQCGDSTWDHYCDTTTEECSACAPLRAAIAALPPHLVARLSEGE